MNRTLSLRSAISSSLLVLAAAGSAPGQALTGNTTTVHLLTGGTQTLDLNAGPAFAGALYIVLGSVTGTSPGFPAGGYTLPLNYDGYFLFTLLNPNTGLLSSSLGFLGGAGTAQTTFNIPPGTDASLAGLGVNHAYGIVDPVSGAVLGVSNAVAVTLAGGAPPLVINEVDYDQPGTDSTEFVEIYNAAPYSVGLAGFSLELANGAIPPFLPYTTLSLSAAGPSIPAFGYLVVSFPGAVGSLPGGTLTIPFAVATNNVQNGAPDGIRIVHVSGPVVDALAYEGAMVGYGEGSPAGTDDPTSAGSLARIPNGSDTSDNGVDFGFTTTPTPGAPNL
jgi:lamin tail-like protein